MTRIDDITRGELASILKRLRALEKATPLSSTSVGNGTLRFYAGSELSIEDGNLTVSGTATVTGELTGGGTFSWTGPVTLTGTTTMTGTTHLNGPTNVAGAFTVTGVTALNGNTTVGGTLKVTGTLEIDGVTTLKNDLNVTSGGSIKCGILTIDPNAASFGGITSATTIYLDAPDTLLSGALTATAVTSLTDLTANGDLTVQGAKNFRIQHPTQPGMWLMHGSTESPVSGIEYSGTVTIGSSGTKQVNLPDYFESLAKPGNRTIFVVGNGFAASWTEITAGAFKVTGTPGGTASWLVKAERIGADFPVVSKIAAAQIPAA